MNCIQRPCTAKNVIKFHPASSQCTSHLAVNCRIQAEVFCLVVDRYNYCATVLHSICSQANRNFACNHTFTIDCRPTIEVEFSIRTYVRLLTMRRFSATTCHNEIVFATSKTKGSTTGLKAIVLAKKSEEFR